MKNHTTLTRQLKLITGLFLLSGFGFFSYAQELIPISPSPEVRNQMHHGGLNSVNHFTGDLGMTIPLYIYEDPDFKIPITLSYSSGAGGFEIESGNVGRGWVLNVGGCVSRIVRGIPDDQTIKIPEYLRSKFIPGYFFDKYHGYMSEHLAMSTIKDVKAANNYPHLLPITGTGWAPFPPHNSSTITFNETEPDLFSFRFGDHSGDFILAPKRELHIFNLGQPETTYTVNLSGFETNNNSGTKTITITTGDGYKYIFGAYYLKRHDYQTVDDEYLTFIPEEDRKALKYKEYNLTWPLTQIISPTGNSVTFEYEMITKRKEIGDASVYTKRRYYTNSSREALVMEERNNNFIGRGIVETSILKKIKIGNNAVISLNYTKDNLLLKTISISSLLDDTAPVQTYQLAYNDIGGDYYMDYDHRTSTLPRISYLSLLKRIIYPSGEQYKFDYNGEELIAKAKKNDQPAVNLVQSAGNYTFKVDYDNFRVSVEGSPYELNEIGLLHKITYPSGGYTKFEYEPHRYSHIVIDEGYLLPVSHDSGYPNTESGARISKITDYSSPSDSTWRYYTYGDAEKKGYLLCFPAREKTASFKYSQSSQNIIDYRDYEYFFNIAYIPTNLEKELNSGIIRINEYRSQWVNRNCFAWGYIRKMDIESMFVAETYSMDISLLKYNGRSVEYPVVYENLSNGAKTEYRFAAYDAYPNQHGSNTSIRMCDGFLALDYSKLPQIEIRWSFCYYEPLNHNYDSQKQWTYQLVDYSKYRGSLISSKTFDGEGRCLSRNELEYKRKQIGDPVLSYRKGIISLIETWTPQLVIAPYKKETTEYFDTGSISKGESTEYDNKVKRVSSKQSNGSTVTVEYFYPKYFAAEPKYTDLINANMENLPVRIITSVRANDSAPLYVTDAVENVYSKINNCIYLTETKKAKINAPVPSSSFNINSYLTDGVKLRYCSDGRIIEVTDQNGIKTTVIWGYNKTNVVAELKNCSFDQAQAAFTYGNLDTFSKQKNYTQSDWDALNALRVPLTDAIITTYEHRLLAGISRITDPSGRSTGYTYDNYGRLMSVIDDEGVIRESYEYNIGQ